MEIGTVFWIVIAYSVVGWILFRSITYLAVKRAMKKKEISLSSSRLLVLTSVLALGAIASGPMTWGNVLRSWIIKRDHLREEK